ncbi:CPBP family intramembrane glutamic endopeptidase [Halovenus rubra]|uniref:CPBP family intramembrane glutamic endopeptidase n=2 Tax=Halovenus rubra TaxID=869890 RepID=A0ACC7E001_9EURY|nr:type II CAAX endopeptidase family protein [Halovenus rubra]
MNGRGNANSLLQDLLVGWYIARGQATDLWRRNDSRRQRVIYGLLALLVFPTVLLLIRGGHSLGVRSRTGIDIEIIAVTRNLLVPGLIAFAILGGLGGAQSLARDPVQSVLLTSAPTRAIVVGKFLYFLGVWLTPMGFLFVPVLAFAIGARSPLFPVAVFVFIIPVLVLTLLIGHTLAYLLWVGIEQLGLPEYARRLLTASLSLLLFVLALTGGFLSGQASATADELPTADPVTPLGWYADLLFVGSPLGGSLGIRPLFAAALVLVSIPLVFAVQVRIAPKFWYASPSRSRGVDDSSVSGDAPDFETPPSGTIGRLGGLTARSQLLRVARGYVTGALRRPDQYVYLLYYSMPILAVILPVALESPAALPPAIGATLVIGGVWVAGALFCLNPLGTEGAMLSQLVLSNTPGKTFVHAKLLIGSCLGLGITLFGIALYVITGPFVTPAFVLVVTPLVGGVVIASSAFALGIGSALPKFETSEVFDSVETLVPSVVAALVHGTTTLLLTGTAVALAALVTAADSPVSLTKQGLALGVFSLVVVVIIDGSRRYAVARLESYGREQTGVGRVFTIYAAAILSLMAVVLGQSVGLSVALVVGLDRPVGLLLPILFVAEYVGYVLVALGFLYVTRRGVAYLDIAWPSKRDIGIIAGGVLASVGVWVLASVLITGLGLPVADHPLFSAEDGDPWLLLVLVPLMLFVNAPVEELLYRNVIQKYVQEWFSPRIAVGVASAIFALAHLPAYFDSNLPSVAVTLSLLFVISCLWGVIYVRTASVLIVSVVHGLYNALLVSSSYIMTVT